MTLPPNKVVSGWRAILDSTDINKEDFLPGFPAGSAGKESTCNAGDLGLIPGLGRSPGEGKGYPPQYSGLENSMDCIVHRVTKSQTQLSDCHFPPVEVCIQHLDSQETLPLGHKTTAVGILC